MASASSGIHLWRTAFLTLRDETQTSSPPHTIHSLIRDLVLSHPTQDLALAAAVLPPHEVTSDVILLMELSLELLECKDVDQSVLQICYLIHDISCKARLAINPASWTLMLNFLKRIVECKFGDGNTGFNSGNGTKMKAITEILEMTRNLDKAYRRSTTVSESMQFAELLISLVSFFHSELLSQKPKRNSILEMQITAFSLIGDTLSRIGPSISHTLWQSLVEVLRKLMDDLASKNLINVDNIMSRFYYTLLHCLHLVLSDPKGSLSEQVTGFGATLQLFFTYGLLNKSLLVTQDSIVKNEISNSKPLTESRKSSAYVPPHLRRRGGTNMHKSSAQSSSDCDSYGLNSSDSKWTVHYKTGWPCQKKKNSSDSDLSDSDGYVKNGDPFRCSKVRVAALFCIQDLCHAEPKLLTSLWTLFLPDTDVLLPRKYQATIMTCLLFDPVMKVRLASASTLASMLDGHSSTFMQVAEHRGSARLGSFTTLSSSLGQILMQLHTGILYLMQHETSTELLGSLFKVLMLLISSTPYARMPENLLPTLIGQLCTRIREDLVYKMEHSGILGSALSCLGAALSVSPPSSHVLKMLEDQWSIDSQASVFSQLIQLSEEGKQLNVRFEALQVLKGLSHHYPGLASLFWENLSVTAYRLLETPNSDDANCGNCSTSRKGDTGKSVGPTFEKCVMAAMKALDESLRAASGFKGAGDLLECRLADIQQIAECSRAKRISSAPSYELEASSNGLSKDCSLGSKQWCEAMENHLPLALTHRSPMVRAAALTCFAGMTSAIFYSLSMEKQEFATSRVVYAALNDEVPSVRSAACRAVGVIACFSQAICSVKVLAEFIHAVEFNSHDPSVSVRITACWALANICDSLRCLATDLQPDRSIGDRCVTDSASLLIESALRLTKDGDKIRANAVRALGNLSRFINFYSMESNWLEKIVHAFVSCVTTGNAKVQWNVCHALGNLFLNDTIKLHEMSWAPSVYSILLLLLRDATNYKIRIHAAVALAVPSSRLDYGNSFCDVVQGLVHVIESINSNQPSAPSSFKYKDCLEKQLLFTTSHVLSLASNNDDQVVKDFLIKKATFLEELFKSNCTNFVESSKNEDVVDLPKKAMVSKISEALQSLIHVYENCNNHNLVYRFETLGRSLR